LPKQSVASLNVGVLLAVFSFTESSDVPVLSTTKSEAER